MLAIPYNGDGPPSTAEDAENYKKRWNAALERREDKLASALGNRMLNNNVNPKTNQLSKMPKKSLRNKAR